MSQIDTDKNYMEIALKAAADALVSGEFPVGCVIADDRGIRATGTRKNSAGESINELDHAEIVALRHLSENGHAVEPATLTIYSTLEPCLMCFGAILISGIRRIVYAYEDAMGGGSACDRSVLPSLYSDAAVVIIPNVFRQKSLALFQSYFKNPASVYLKETFFAEYTLRQDLNQPYQKFPDRHTR